MRSNVILFFRGLNSYGKDRLSFGPFRGQHMHAPLQAAMSKRGFHFIPVLQMGKGSIKEHVKKALQFLDKNADFKSGNVQFHLLGHSTGGIIARAFAHEFVDQEKILSITTMASPHHGTPLADQVFDYHKNHPFKFKSLKWFGYDITSKLNSFHDLRPKVMQNFNLHYKDLDSIQYASCVFKLNRSSMSLPVRFFSHLSDTEKLLKDSDGFVDIDSQKWGQVIAELELDHLSQIGFNAFMNPTKRRQTRIVFETLCNNLASHWENI